MTDVQPPVKSTIELKPVHQVNIYEVKSQLSRLVEHVESGGEYVIARNGRPVALLVALNSSAKREWHHPGDGNVTQQATGGQVIAQCCHLTITTTKPNTTHG